MIGLKGIGIVKKRFPIGTVYGTVFSLDRPAITPSPVSLPSIMSQEYLQLLVTCEMPYGKYKGRLIADLPGHYLGWFAREGFPAGELGRLIALMYELDHNALRHLLDPLRKDGNMRISRGK